MPGSWAIERVKPLQQSDEVAAGAVRDQPAASIVKGADERQLARQVGRKTTGALADLGTWTVEIIKRSDTAKGFELLPRRWVVERTLA